MISRSKKGGTRVVAGASAPPGVIEAYFRVLYPAGIRPEQYPDALAVVRILDKRYGAQRVEEERKKPLSDRPLRKRKRRYLARANSFVPYRGRPRRG